MWVGGDVYIYSHLYILFGGGVLIGPTWSLGVGLMSVVEGCGLVIWRGVRPWHGGQGRNHWRGEVRLYH